LVFNPREFISEKVSWLRAEIKSMKAAAAASGGVDSTVTAMLGHKAVGEKLTVLFLDDGLMRDGEPDSVVTRYKQLGLNAKLCDVKHDFFEALKGVVDPEAKRKAFRSTFYTVLGRLAAELGATYLLQGTIAADVVETQGGVKTQHNVLEQIGINPLQKYGFKVLEPIKELYKPDVRRVAAELGLPEDMHQRRPFPGPGLALRVLGEVTPERVETVRKATKVVEEETASMSCFQSFAVLLNDKATGVREGKRVFGEILTIRIVDSQDAMTATVPRVPWEKLERMRVRLTDELPQVVKVLFDLSPKPPSTIEYI